MLASDGKILEKNDQTPVTVADFGVQALVSLGNSLFNISEFLIEMQCPCAHSSGSSFEKHRL